MKFIRILSSIAVLFVTLQFSIISSAQQTEPLQSCNDDFEAIYMIELSEAESIIAVEQIDADYSNCTETYNYKASAYDFSTDYFYNQLNEEGKELYDGLVDSCEEFANSTVNITATTDTGNGLIAYIPYDAASFTKEELRMVFYAFYYSNPQFFFLANGFATGYLGSSYFICPIAENAGPDFLLSSSRSKYQASISQLTSQWMQEIEACSTDFEKERLICEKLCDTITYTFTDIDQTLAGALVDKACVCNGYAMAVTYFCNAAGIDCITVVSKNHAWNRVMLNEVWYEVDTTWMDQNTYIWYDWFNKSSATFKANDSDNMHTIDPELYDGFFCLPDCDTDGIDKLDTPYFTGMCASLDSVTLDWSTVKYATSYRVYRSESLTGAKTLLKAVATTNYTDATAEAGKTYYYFVKAYNGEYSLLSNYSEAVSVTMPTAPAKPTNVKALSGGGNATISWDAVSDATSYRVYRSTSLTGTRTLEKVRTSTYYIDTNVDTGKTYYYWIVSYNADTGLKSGYSSTKTVTIKDAFATSIEIKSASVLSTSVTLKWDMVPGATSYRIYRRNDDNSRSLIHSQSMTEFKDTGLTKGKAYTYEIKAYSATTKTLTEYSPKKTVRPMAAPTILSGNVRGKITWDKNAVATSYRVYRADSRTGAKKLLDPTQALTYTDTTAVNGKQYYYFVAAYDNTTGTLSAYSQPKVIKISK